VYTHDRYDRLCIKYHNINVFQDEKSKLSKYSDNFVMMVVVGNVGARTSLGCRETEIGTSSQQTFDHIDVTVFARLKPNQK
jgi:hypothetical protein